MFRIQARIAITTPPRGVDNHVDIWVELGSENKQDRVLLVCPIAELVDEWLVIEEKHQTEPPDACTEESFTERRLLVERLRELASKVENSLPPKHRHTDHFPG